LGACLVGVSCGDQNPSLEANDAQPIEVTSNAFGDGETIPRKYTCDGDDVSPPLRWKDDGARGYVVTLMDPDAGGFVHWIAFDLPAAVTSLDEGELPGPAREGSNDFGDRGYEGPCPPEGDDPHRYVFTIYGLDRGVELDEGASFADVLDAIDCCVESRGTLSGSYGR
jgi:Raf kinase inhibitor-like YbhB/YbcL family protein